MFLSAMGASRPNFAFASSSRIAVVILSMQPATLSDELLRRRRGSSKQNYGRAKSPPLVATIPLHKHAGFSSN